MTIPDGRAWDSPLPAFSTVAEFRACTRLIRNFTDLRDYTATEAVVPCAVERIGGYRCSGGLTELTDILFGPEDRCRHVFPLVRGDYDVLRIVDCPAPISVGSLLTGTTAANVYFTMIALCGVEPVTWQRFPISYGSDAYNMTVTSPDCRRRIIDIIRPNDEYSEEYWNPMCDMVLCYDESHYQKFEALGVHLSPPDGFGQAVLTPTSKVATFYVGYTAEHELVAIQGRWL